MSLVPDEFYQETLDNESLKAFFEDKKLLLVMESFSCDGYFLYLSSKSESLLKTAAQPTFSLVVL